MIEKTDVELAVSVADYLKFEVEQQEFHDGPDIEWIKEQLDLENRTGIREMEQTSSDVESRYEYDQEQKRSLGQGDFRSAAEPGEEG
ncbi:MAG: hypothetical protein WA364_22320, partial [Candidatus Nitrosopolaris sp.]